MGLLQLWRRWEALKRWSPKEKEPIRGLGEQTAAGTVGTGAGGGNSQGAAAVPACLGPRDAMKGRSVGPLETPQKPCGLRMQFKRDLRSVCPHELLQTHASSQPGENGLCKV